MAMSYKETASELILKSTCNSVVKFYILQKEHATKIIYFLIVFCFVCSTSRTRVRKSGTLCHCSVTVTSPTTVALYVSMTSELRVLSTEKH